MGISDKLWSLWSTFPQNQPVRFFLRRIIVNIQQMVFHHTLFLRSCFVRDDWQAFVDLHHVGVDDFAIEPFSDGDAEVSFSGAGGAEYRDNFVAHEMCV